MLDLIVTEHNFGTPFWQLASCFYRRNLDLEEAYCIPYTELRSGPFIGTQDLESKSGVKVWILTELSI